MNPTRTQHLFIGGEMDSLWAAVPEGRDHVNLPMEDDVGTEMYLRHTIPGPNNTGVTFFALKDLTLHDALQLLIDNYKPETK